MFKASILRHARLGGVLGVQTILNGSRSALQPARQSWNAVSRLSTPSTRFLSTSRALYSAAAEPVLDNPSATAEEVSNTTVTKFSQLPALGVHPNLVRSLNTVLKYENMTEVQEKTINAALAGKDLIAQARTGTGKTLAFLIPIVQRIIAQDENLAWAQRVRARSDDIRAIILSPTRELAEQIGVEAKKLCSGTGIITQIAVGGTQKSMMLQQTRRQGCHLLVATPGRLFDLLNDPYSGIDAPRLTTLVLDEADRMLDVGFEAELKEIVRLLPSRDQSPRQTLLFSATIPSNVINIAKAYLDPKNFEFVQTVRNDEAPTHERVPQHIVTCKGYENLYPTILELIEREVAAHKAGDSEMPFKAIVFLPTTSHVRLAKTLFDRISYSNRNLPRLFEIHSKLTQAQRNNASEGFRRSSSAILMSSDVSARGVDYPNVSHVIQLGCPPSRDQYIHRVGRTGRAGKGGQAWLVVTEDEVPLARRTLPSLPIKRSQDLECAQYSVGSDDASTPSAISQVSEAMPNVAPDVLQEVYMSFFGGFSRGMDMQLVVDGLNHWVKTSWGWDKPPAIDMNTARKRGLSNIVGLNITSGYSRGGSSFDRRSGGGGYGSRDHGGGRGFEGRGQRVKSLDDLSRFSRDESSSQRRRPAAF